MREVRIVAIVDIAPAPAPSPSGVWPALFEQVAEAVQVVWEVLPQRCRLLFLVVGLKGALLGGGGEDWGWKLGLGVEFRFGQEGSGLGSIKWILNIGMGTEAV